MCTPRRGNRCVALFVNRLLPSPPFSASPTRQVLIHEFESWASVQAERTLQFDWDDAMGKKARREAALRLEKLRNVSAGH